MDIAERVNIQKNKELPARLKINSNNESDEIDNYIISHKQIKENQVQQQTVKDIRKILEKTIQDQFKK